MTTLTGVCARGTERFVSRVCSCIFFGVLRFLFCWTGEVSIPVIEIVCSGTTDKARRRQVDGAVDEV